jgi:DNA processing protein
MTDTQELIDMMGWETTRERNTKQQELFIELNENEQKLLPILRQKETVHIDELNMHSGLSSSMVAAAILNMELQGVLQCLPGKMYKLTAHY